MAAKKTDELNKSNRTLAQRILLPPVKLSEEEPRATGG
jgi:hypothetical protein